MQSINTGIQNFENKTAIVRANFDVPFKDGVVLDTTRIEANLDTLRLLRAHHCPIRLLAHQDRPDGHYLEAASLKSIIPLLTSLLGEPVTLIPYSENFTQTDLGSEALVLLDNLRFWPQEEANDPEFGRWLASLGHFYVNEAFANCHRQHASIVGIPPVRPSFAGITLYKEIEAINKVVKNPRKPLVVIIGGAKLDTKEPLVNTFAPMADAILVGGKVALDLKQKTTNLPPNILIADLVPDGKDITPASAQTFAEKIMAAGTVFWNGTMGICEEVEHQLGTKIVATAVNQTQAYTIIGGGDTETALTLFNLEAGIDHISSGGGALLEYLSLGSLPGIDVLDQYAPKS